MNPKALSWRPHLVRNGGKNLRCFGMVWGGTPNLPGYYTISSYIWSTKLQLCVQKHHSWKRSSTNVCKIEIFQTHTNTCSFPLHSNLFIFLQLCGWPRYSVSSRYYRATMPNIRFFLRVALLLGIPPQLICEDFSIDNNYDKVTPKITGGRLKIMSECWTRSKISDISLVS